MTSAGDIAPVVIGSVLIALAAAFSQTGDRRSLASFIREAVDLLATKRGNAKPKEK